MTDETRRRLLVLADHLETAAREAKARGEPLAALALLEGAVMARAVLEGGLPPVEIERIVRTMNVDTTRHPSDVKRGATRARRKHPAQKKLYEQGMTIASLAKALGETRARVSSWMADGDGLRPIPAHIAEKLRDKYGIPLSVWRRVAE